MPEGAAEAPDDSRTPSCPECGGWAKTATVLFGEPLPERVQSQAMALISACDALLVVGTSLNVHPAASFPELARSRGGSPAPIVEINAMHATSPAMPDVMITGRAGVWLPRLAALLLQRDESAGATKLALSPL